MRYCHYTMTAVIIIIQSLIGSRWVKGQSSIENLLGDGVEEWHEISFRCSELVPVYFERGDQDTLQLILKTWEEETGVMEPIRRFWMLNQINRNEFNTDFINNVVVEDMYRYKNRVDSQPNDSTDWTLWGPSQSKNAEYVISSEFNRFTYALANELLSYTDLSDDEWLICSFYAHEFDKVFSLFQQGEASHTKVYRRFAEDYAEQSEQDLHFDMFVGHWSPRRSFLILDKKIVVGGGVGLEWRRLLIDAVLRFQFLNTKDTYTVVYRNERFDTKHYFGFYLGVEPAFKLYEFSHLQINLLSGAALDLIEVVPEGDNPFEEESINLVGLNLNLGIGTRIFWQDTPYYVRAQIRYEYSGFNTHGGTDLSDGEALFLRLGFGWDDNHMKHKIKKYFPRQ